MLNPLTLVMHLTWCNRLAKNSLKVKERGFCCHDIMKWKMNCSFLWRTLSFFCCRIGIVCPFDGSCSALYDNSSLSLWIGVTKRNCHGSLPLFGCLGKSFRPGCSLYPFLDDWAWNLLLARGLRPNHSIPYAKDLQDSLNKNMMCISFLQTTTVFNFFFHLFFHIFCDNYKIMNWKYTCHAM